MKNQNRFVHLSQYSHRIPVKAGVPNRSGSGELLRPFPSPEKDVAPEREILPLAPQGETFPFLRWKSNSRRSAKCFFGNKPNCV